jgi:hypothetical protein
MRAEFVRELDGDVTFLRGGKLLTVPLDKLSAADQQVVRDLAAGKPPPEEVPATPKAGDFGSDTPAIDSEATDKTPENTPASPGSAAQEKPLIRTPIPIENRTWTDIHGNQTTARYVRIFGSNVVLSRGGRSVTVKFHELVESDQEYLRELLTSHGQESMIPPKVTDLNLDAPEETTESESTSSSAPARGMPPSAPTDPSERDFNPPPGGQQFPPSVGTPSGGSASGYGGSSYSPSSAPASTGTSASALPAGMNDPSGAAASGYGSSSSNSSNPYSSSGYGSSRPPIYNNFSGPLVINQPGSSSTDPVVGACSSCRREITRSQSSASNCPHCGAYWTYKQDGTTRQTLPLPKLSAPAVNFDPQTSRTIAIVLGSFVGLLVVVGLIIGVMYAVMGLAKVSSANRDQSYLR